MPLFARPWNHAPTMYAAAVSREYMTCSRVSKDQDQRIDDTDSSNTHKVVIELESTEAHRSYACV